jgi:hypothetical protein
MKKFQNVCNRNYNSVNNGTESSSMRIGKGRGKIEAEEIGLKMKKRKGK